MDCSSVAAGGRNQNSTKLLFVNVTKIICQCRLGTNILEASEQKHFIVTSTKCFKGRFSFKFYEKTLERIQIAKKFNFLKIVPNWLPVILCLTKVCEISSPRFTTYLIRWNGWKSKKHFSLKRIVFKSLQLCIFHIQGDFCTGVPLQAGPLEVQKS